MSQNHWMSQGQEQAERCPKEAEAVAGLASSLTLGDSLPPGKSRVSRVRTGYEGQLWVLLGLSTLLLSFFLSLCPGFPSHA